MPTSIDATIQRRGLAVMMAIALTLGLLHAAATCAAEEPMTYRHNGPESASDKRYDYHWEILRTALEYTREQYGPYRIEKSQAMTETRQLRELQKADGLINLMYLGTNAELEERLTPVRIPVDRNLSGYFILLIRAGDQPRFDRIQSLEQLRSLTFGMGSGWLDVNVYAHNQLKVVTGSQYDGLFFMLMANRFDAFPRSGVEIIGELELRRDEMPNLHMERNLLLTYTWPMYFWFAKSEEGRRLAKRVESGMLAMIEDGSYERIFDKYYRADIQRLRLGQRRLIQLENPMLPALTPLHDTRLWYVPQAVPADNATP